MADLLLVDNDRRIAELCAWFLERRGHRVRLAASYAEARERILERAPDLMLADLELGAESGREELPRLASERLLPPTLIVSGYLDRELDRELCGLPCVLGTVAKPFDIHELVRRVEVAVARSNGAPIDGCTALLASMELAAPAEETGGWIEIGSRDDGGRSGRAG